MRIISIIFAMMAILPGSSVKSFIVLREGIQLSTFSSSGGKRLAAIRSCCCCGRLQEIAPTFRCSTAGSHAPAQLQALRQGRLQRTMAKMHLSSDPQLTAGLPVLKRISSLHDLYAIIEKFDANDLAPWEAAMVLNHIGRLLNAQRIEQAEERAAFAAVFDRFQIRVIDGMNELDAKNIAWVLNAAKRASAHKLFVNSSQELFEASAAQLLQLDRIKLQNLALIMNAFAFHGSNINSNFTSGSEFAGTLFKHLEKNALDIPFETYHESPQSLAMLLNGVVRLGWKQSRIIPFLARVFLSMPSSSFSIHSLCLVAHTYSLVPFTENVVLPKLGSTDIDQLLVLERVSAAILRMSPTSLYPQAIATLSSSFARAQIHKSAIYDHLLLAISVSNFSLWETQAIANTMNAFSSIGHTGDAVMARLAGVPFLNGGSKHSILTRHVVMILNALTRMRVFDQAVFRSFAALIISSRGTSMSEANPVGAETQRTQPSKAHDLEGDWSAQEVAAVALAYATIASNSPQNSNEFSQRSNVPSLWCFEGNMADVSQHVLLHLSGKVTSFERKVWRGPDGAGQAAANMINALAKVGLRHSAALDHLASALAEEVESSTRNTSLNESTRVALVNNFAQALHGLASLNHPHDNFLCRACKVVSESDTETLKGQTLANLAWGFAVFDNIVQDGVHQHMMAAVASNLESLLQGREMVHSGTKRALEQNASKAGSKTVQSSKEPKASFVDLQELRQVHQYLISRRFATRNAKGLVGESVPDDKVQALARSVFEARSRNRAASSKLQAQVAETLRLMGLRVELEYMDPTTGYSVDITLYDPHSLDHKQLQPLTAIEVDGPLHYARPEFRIALGHTVMKRRHLEQAGWTVVSVPFWEWSKAGSVEEKKAYLAGRLGQPLLDKGALQGGASF